MSSKISQRAVYLVTGVIVASMVGGFALATMSLSGATNASHQGSQTTTVSSVAGLTWNYTNVSVVGGAAAVTNPCEVLTSACVVTSTSYTICAGAFSDLLTCSPGDFVEQVTLTTVRGTAFPATVALTVYVTGTPIGGSGLTTFAGPTAYFTDTAPLVTTYIVLDFDIGTSGTGPGAVSSVSVVATT